MMALFTSLQLNKINKKHTPKKVCRVRTNQDKLRFIMARLTVDLTVGSSYDDKHCLVTSDHSV